MNPDSPFRDYGCDVFSEEAMKNCLTPDVYECLRNIMEEGRELTYDIASAVASAMKDWALKKGATHYTHWFQPMTGATAEKHNSFLERKGYDVAPILEFSGKALIRGEADGSSFPSGGLRATFEARGYTTWDCTSPAFLKRDVHGNCTLCIPTAFCSFSGDALDEKTPLLRSMEALNRQAVRVLHLLGETDVKRVIPTVGGEQEYFLVDKAHFLKRKDLVYSGRTLFGASPAKSQEMSDQYYAVTPDRVAGFMRELDATLWRLGVPAKTEHNETAPAQYELAPIYASANVATDHNQMIMEQMRRIAERHGFICLLHEKPFANINGSGKHNNWSLTTDTGRNLLKPGKTTSANRVFYTFFIAVLAAADEYAEALRMSCATLGNEYRLGGHEAPPGIISAFIGAKLHEELLSFASGHMDNAHQREHMSTGVSTMAILHKDDTDRNRTSPFAFTGDKFEFRMVGSSQSLGLPNTTLNTIVAEMLQRIADALEASQDPISAWKGIMGDLIEKHERIIFNGNNYSQEWAEEAARRGLPHIANTVAGIAVMDNAAVQDVFERHCVLSRSELFARMHIAYWSFVQSAHIEAATMLKISRQKLMPACIRYSGALAQACNATEAAGAPATAQRRILHSLCALMQAFDEKIEALAERLHDADCEEANSATCAHAISTRVLPAMQELRAVADSLECIVDKEYWPLPSYGEMLFYIV